MTDLSAFDAAFQASLAAQYEQFGVDMAYTPPGGGAAVEGVRVIPDERDREHDAGDFGQMRSAERTGRILTADPKMQKAGVSPARGGILTRANGARLKIDGAPREDNGEWVLDLVEAG